MQSYDKATTEVVSLKAQEVETELNSTPVQLTVRPATYR
jgi:hypothetical protein